ncbi:unnamed protein product [Scytosiphon promiscuus]
MTALGTVEFWDTFHGREHTEWYLPVDVVVREVLRVYADLTTQLQASPGNQAGVRGGGSGCSVIADGNENGEGTPRKHPRILHPGCGSSTVGVVLQLEHGCDVVNADFSEGVMDSMRARYPGCEFVRSDARDAAGFRANSFDLAIDKGLFDSVTARTEGREEAAKKLLGEAARVLSPGGKYMLFSAFSNDGLGHKDMADMLAHPGFGGEVQIRVLDTPPLEYPDQSSSYLYILTKVVEHGGSAAAAAGAAAAPRT